MRRGISCVCVYASLTDFGACDVQNKHLAQISKTAEVSVQLHSVPVATPLNHHFVFGDLLTIT